MPFDKKRLGDAEDAGDTDVDDVDDIRGGEQEVPSSVGSSDGQGINIQNLNIHELFLFEFFKQNMPSPRHNRYMYEKGCSLFAPAFGMDAPVPPDLADVRFDYGSKFPSLAPLVQQFLLMRDDSNGSLLTEAYYQYDRALKQCWNDIMQALTDRKFLEVNPLGLGDHMISVLTEMGVRSPFMARGAQGAVGGTPGGR
jgi:hypothetical protein